MTNNMCRWIAFCQLPQQGMKCLLLLYSACVSLLAILSESALVDDAQGATVITSGMHALHGFGQQGNDITVETHVVVVTTLSKLGLTAGNQVLHAEGLVASGCRAVDNQQFNIGMLQWLHHIHIQLWTARVPMTEVRMVIII